MEQHLQVKVDAVTAPRGQRSAAICSVDDGDDAVRGRAGAGTALDDRHTMGPALRRAWGLPKTSPCVYTSAQPAISKPRPQGYPGENAKQRARKDTDFSVDYDK